MSHPRVTGEVEALKADVARLRADIAGLAEALLQAGRQEAGEARSRVEEEARQHLEGLRSRMDGARDLGRDAIRSVQSHIEERPFVSILAALATGLVLGKLLDRR